MVKTGGNFGRERRCGIAQHPRRGTASFRDAGSQMPRLTINLLGSWEARAAEGRILRLASRKSQALLAYLAMPAGRRHQREALAALLWGEVDDGRARASLRQALLTIRGALGSDAGLLRLDLDEVALDGAAVRVDAAELERSLALGSSGTADAIML